MYYDYGYGWFEDYKSLVEFLNERQIKPTQIVNIAAEGNVVHLIYFI